MKGTEKMILIDEDCYKHYVYKSCDKVEFYCDGVKYNRVKYNENLYNTWVFFLWRISATRL